MIDEFSKAAIKIGSWELTSLPPTKRKLIHDFGSHIASRAELLRNQLPRKNEGSE
jgi:hypothetical protein